jgi:hypothetical protein
MSPRLPSRIDLQPGEDLLPLPLKGIFVGAPKAMHPFSPLLLTVQGLESCCWIGNAFLDRKISRRTLFYRKDAERGRKGG